jgi:hypothetical protein
MAILTAAQIKTILEGAVYPEDVEINGALMQNDERRKYPSIDVQNITGEEKFKEFPTSTIGQTFLVHLFYRYRSFGEQEEAKIKALEDVIFDTIDNNANFSINTKVTVTEGWRRNSETFPVRRSHSVLTVSSEEISATSPANSATPGDKINITIPNVGTFKVIAIPVDQFGLTKQLDLGVTVGVSTEEIFTKIHEGGLLSVELALTPAEELTLHNEVNIGDDATLTLDLNGTNRTLVVNYIDTSASSSREVVRTTILSMDVKSWA